MSENVLVLIDGHALIYRAYHAFPVTLQTSKGELTNAVYGFTSILLNTIKALNPKYMVVAFDKKGPTFRHKKFKEYKAHRKKPDKEMLKQIPRIKQVVKALNLPIFEERGFEADDVIGTLAKKSKVKVIIVTGDQDALQLVNNNVKVWMPPRGRFVPARMYDGSGVEEKLGIKPSQVVDYKALVGDPSDNIPGVVGIGPLTARKLLGEYKTFEEVYKNINRINPKVSKKLVDQRKMAVLSQELAQIHTNAPVKLDLKCCLLNDYNKDETLKLFTELEFKSLIKRLPSDNWEQMAEDVFKSKPKKTKKKVKVKKEDSAQMGLF